MMVISVFSAPIHAAGCGCGMCMCTPMVALMQQTSKAKIESTKIEKEKRQYVFCFVPIVKDTGCVC